MYGDQICWQCADRRQDHDQGIMVTASRVSVTVISFLRSPPSSSSQCNCEDRSLHYPGRCLAPLYLRLSITICGSVRNIVIKLCAFLLQEDTKQAQCLQILSRFRERNITRFLLRARCLQILIAHYCDCNLN